MPLDLPNIVHTLLLPLALGAVVVTDPRKSSCLVPTRREARTGAVMG